MRTLELVEASTSWTVCADGSLLPLLAGGSPGPAAASPSMPLAVEVPRASGPLSVDLKPSSGGSGGGRGGRVPSPSRASSTIGRPRSTAWPPPSRSRPVLGEASSPRLGDAGLEVLLAVRGVPSRWSRSRPFRRGEPLGEVGPPCVSTVHSSCQGSGSRRRLLVLGQRACSSARTTRSVAGRLETGLPILTGEWPTAPLAALGQKLHSKKRPDTAHICPWMSLLLT
mmetsp:Transcript_12757/g.36189  ORF Transcript_12757/g.36189 Transcript_12757/m.36189 type:complete len:226 (+) Transcript_12757:1011-1688(+)